VNAVASEGLQRDARAFVLGIVYGVLATLVAIAPLAWPNGGDATQRRSPGIDGADGPPAHVGELPAGTSGGPAPPAPSPEPTLRPTPGRAPELAARRLRIPVQGVEVDQLTRSFDDARGGGRAHQAIDILAPRNTPVIAVEDGTIARLFNSRAGGITIYQFDPSEEFCYYYAHLERYAEGLVEGQPVRRGQVLGYVGTSGNAPAGTPHLHFAVYRLTPDKRWWEGTPIDPYDLLR
jgi:peptidoglycan LD-endopeptidase LytH